MVGEDDRGGKVSGTAMVGGFVGGHTYLDVLGLLSNSVELGSVSQTQPAGNILATEPSSTELESQPKTSR